MNDRPGPEKYLTTMEEEELAHFLIGCAAIGYPRTRTQVICIVQQHLRRKGIEKELRKRCQLDGGNDLGKDSLPHLWPNHELAQPRAQAMSQETLRVGKRLTNISI